MDDSVRQSSMCVGFYGMFRGSKLVGIQWRHVHFPGSGGVMISVPSSETDTQGAGAWVILPAPKGQEGAMVDIVAALQQLREMQGGRVYVFLARRDGGPQQADSDGGGCAIYCSGSEAMAHQGRSHHGDATTLLCPCMPGRTGLHCCLRCRAVSV